MKPITLKDFSSNLFWDIDPSELNQKRHIKYIVARVLEIGTFDDWQLLCRLFTLETIITVAQKLRFIDPKSLAFLSTVGHVPRETFRCYTSKSLMQTHWIY